MNSTENVKTLILKELGETPYNILYGEIANRILETIDELKGFEELVEYECRWIEEIFKDRTGEDLWFSLLQSAFRLTAFYGAVRGSGSVEENDNE